jgi:hypothetical protein
MHEWKGAVIGMVARSARSAAEEDGLAVQCPYRHTGGYEMLLAAAALSPARVSDSAPGDSANR